MTTNPLQMIPVQAPVQVEPFPLLETILSALARAGESLQDGDVLAISSKYVAIAENRVVTLRDVQPAEKALMLAERYNMDVHLTELIVREADHIFGGIPMGYLLTWRSGIIAPNAGIDRSNIPGGKAVLLPEFPYKSARDIHQALQEKLQIRVGVLLTDSWLVPGRYGTTGVALATAGFEPLQDERGKKDLFGNPMQVTQRGIADSLSVCAQMVMGERDEATPLAILRHADVTMTDAEIELEDLAIPWEMCIYVESLTLGLLPGGAPEYSHTAHLTQRKSNL